MADWIYAVIGVVIGFGYPLVVIILAAKYWAKHKI